MNQPDGLHPEGQTAELESGVDIPYFCPSQNSELRDNVIGNANIVSYEAEDDPANWKTYRCGCEINQDPWFPDDLARQAEGGPSNVFRYHERRTLVKAQHFLCQRLDLRCLDEPGQGIQIGQIWHELRSHGDTHSLLFDQTFTYQGLVVGCREEDNRWAINGDGSILSPVIGCTTTLSKKFHFETIGEGNFTQCLNNAAYNVERVEGQATLTKTIDLIRAYTVCRRTLGDFILVDGLFGVRSDEARWRECLGEEHSLWDVYHLNNAGDPWPDITECLIETAGDKYEWSLRRRNNLENYGSLGIGPQNGNNDVDADGVCNIIDSCPFVPNAINQQGPSISYDRSDLDGIGEECDLCPHFAEFPYHAEAGILPYRNLFGNENGPNPIIPFEPARVQTDSDRDGIGDSCDLLLDPNRPEDQDGDGVNDAIDNCPADYNPYPLNSLEQVDADEDGLGDPFELWPALGGANAFIAIQACDLCPTDRYNDIDGDGRCGNTLCGAPKCEGSEDIAPYDNQDRFDGDPWEACDEDTRNYMIFELGNPLIVRCDNCPDLAQEDQSDIDGDRLGDLCDDDMDGDDIENFSDNCPEQFNAEQIDLDDDGIGDVCDDFVDRDNDNVADEEDNCPDDANSNQRDSDNDGQGNVCDYCPEMDNDLPDPDGDCFANNGRDKCPEMYTELNVDHDGDSVGDQCDNCPYFANENQADSDEDQVGDGCDNCELYNPGQWDGNGNGLGDVCERPFLIFSDGASTTRLINYYATIDEILDNRLENLHFPFEILVGEQSIAELSYSLTYEDDGEQIVVIPRTPLALDSRHIVLESPLLFEAGDGPVDGPERILRSGHYQLRLHADSLQWGEVVTELGLNILSIHASLSSRPDSELFRYRWRSGGYSPGRHGLERNTVMINHDDDNGNTVIDGQEDGWVEAENDLAYLGLLVRSDRPLEGRFQLRQLNPEQGVRLWSTAYKEGELVLPFTFPALERGVGEYIYLSSGIYVEGLQTGRVSFELSFTPDGENEALMNEFYNLDVVQLDVIPAYIDNFDEVINGQDPYIAEYLNIGLLENIVDNNGAMINGPGDPNFIDLDSDRFYIRLTSEGANVSSDEIDHIGMSFNTGDFRVGTVDSRGESYYDDLTEILLRETGPDSGVFLSEAQLLTAPELGNYYDFSSRRAVNPVPEDEETCELSGYCSDDNLPVWGRDVTTLLINDVPEPVLSRSSIPDDAPGDRTHQTWIDGDVEIRFTTPFINQSIRIPVCQRSPDIRREVYVRMTVPNEPFQDVGVERLNEVGEVVIVGAGNGVFDFFDANGNAVCDCADLNNNSTCDPIEAECEPFLDMNKNEIFANYRDTSFSRIGYRNAISNRLRADMAKILLQQACLQMVLVDYQEIDEPRNENGEGIFVSPPMTSLLGDADAFKAENSRDLTTLYQSTLFPSARTDIMDLIIYPWGHYALGGAATAYHRNVPPPLGNYLFSPQVAANASAFSAVTAHEYLHLLAQSGHEGGNLPAAHRHRLLLSASSPRTVLRVTGLRRISHQLRSRLWNNFNNFIDFDDNAPLFKPFNPLNFAGESPYDYASRPEELFIPRLGEIGAGYSEGEGEAEWEGEDLDVNALLPWEQPAENVDGDGLIIDDELVIPEGE